MKPARCGRAGIASVRRLHRTDELREHASTVQHSNRWEDSLWVWNADDDTG